MAYVVQQPHSNTNNTDKFRIVEFYDWHKAMWENGPTPPSFGQFDNYEDAMFACYQMNHENE